MVVLVVLMVLLVVAQRRSEICRLLLSVELLHVVIDVSSSSKKRAKNFMAQVYLLLQQF